MTEQPPETGQVQDGLATAIAERQAQRGRATVFDLVSSMEAEFAKALPKQMPLETFMRVAVTELRQNPDLQACSSDSLLGALMTAARLGLEVGGPMGHFYLTPRNVKNKATGQPGKQVVPIIGYRGLVKLARNTGQVGAVKAWVVYEGDHFEEGANSERGPYFDFRKAPGGPAGRKEVGVIAVAKLAGGDVQHTYLTLDEVLDRKARGAAGDRGPWATDREAMIRKTGIRALASELPQSTALALARQIDEQVQSYIPGQVDTATGELTS
jgi:recombination protein RecT